MYDVAVLHLGQRTAHGGFRGDVDGGGNLARGAGHAPVGDESDLVATVHEHAECGDQGVQFRHPLRPWALVAQHHDDVAVQLTRAEGLGEVGLGGEDARGGTHGTVLRCDGRDLDDRAAEVSVDHAKPALGGEGVVGGAEHGVVERGRGHVAPGHRVAVQDRFLAVAVQSGACDGLHVGVQQARVQEGPDEYLDASGGVEVVDVGAAVGVDVREQRHGRRQVGEVVPGELDACRGGDGDEVQRVVLRAAGGEQRDDPVDDAALVDHMGDRRVLVALGDLHDAARSLFRECLAQRRAGLDEGRPGQVQAHHLDHELVGVRGAVEGAGAG